LEWGIETFRLSKFSIYGIGSELENDSSSVFPNTDTLAVYVRETSKRSPMITIGVVTPDFFDFDMWVDLSSG